MGAHDSVVVADQGFRAPSGDQESVRDSVHEDSASARIAAGQRPRPSFRHPHVEYWRSTWRWWLISRSATDVILGREGHRLIEDGTPMTMSDSAIP